jgi:hypothetical protein
MTIEELNTMADNFLQFGVAMLRRDGSITMRLHRRTLHESRHPRGKDQLKAG